MSRQIVVAAFLLIWSPSGLSVFAANEPNKAVSEDFILDVKCRSEQPYEGVTPAFIDAFCKAVEEGLQKRIPVAAELPRTVTVIISGVTANSFIANYTVQASEGAVLNNQAQIDIVDAGLRPSMGDVLASEITRAVSNAK